MESITQIDPPVSYAPLLHSGIEVIDRAWGGLYRGGSYLVYGRAASGRDLLTLRFTQLGAELGESCLFISPQRPKDLMIQAASIGFDLRGAYEAGLVKLLRIPPTMAYQGSEDDGILRAMRDLVALIRQHRPQRLVVNDFMPFVLFRSFDRLKAAVVDLLEHTDVLDMTMLLVMSEPGNEQSKRIVEFVGSQMTGSVRVEMLDDQPEATRRRLTLTPNIGHIRGTRSEMLDLDALLVPPVADTRGERPLLPSSVVSAAPSPPVYRGIRLGSAPAEEPEAAAPPEHRPYGGMPSHVTYGGLHAGQPRQAAELPSVPVFPVNFGASAPETRTAPRRAVTEPTLVAAVPVTPVAPVQPPAAQAPPAPIPVTPPSAPPPAQPQVPHAQMPQQMPVADPYGAAGAYGMAPPAPVMPPPMPTATYTPPPSAETTTDRMTFARMLDEQFRKRAQQGIPFLLVAMRLDAQAMQPLGFEFVSDAVAEALRAGDAVYLDPRASRLVALLGGSTGDESGAFFTRLKARMREEAPAHAETLLRAVEAVVIPDGDPFKTADAVLAYVLDNA